MDFAMVTLLGANKAEVRVKGLKRDHIPQTKVRGMRKNQKL